MRIATILAGTILLAASPAFAQLPPQLAVGQMEVKAYQKIPKAKAAVQLTQDTALGRHLRGKVMERLSKRGLEVGFSGGNVMRMDLSYFDLNLGGGGSTRGNSAADTPSSSSPGDNQRPTILGLGRTTDPSAAPPAPPTLRLTLTLYSVDSGKVLWTATGTCATVGGMAPKAGEAIIGAIFDNADKSIVGDANCPI
jgi:hypothetical protein